GGRMAEGQKALTSLRDGSTEIDRQELQRLVTRKTITEESGLTRTDGRRDRAGGQRIGELLAGKFPRAAMPSRRRAEVCVDVLLEILTEKDPVGYAEGRYGTREIWHDLWLEADQPRLPTIDPRGTTVLGALDVALRELADTVEWDPALRAITTHFSHAPDGTEQAASVTDADSELRDRLEIVRVDLQREADRQVAVAHAERDDARRRAEAAEEAATSTR